MTFDERRIEVLETLAEIVGDYKHAIHNPSFQETVSLETLRSEMFNTYNAYIQVLDSENDEEEQ